MKKVSPYDKTIVELLKLSEKYKTSSARDIDGKIKSSDISSIQQRDELYINHIRNYTVSYNKRVKGQFVMKWIFFIVIMLVLIGLVLGTVLCILLVLKRDNTTINDVSIVGTAMAGVISAFIVLPRVIAKNLFPTTEDDRSAEIFKSVIENDMELRRFHAKKHADIHSDTESNMTSVDDL